MVCESAMRKVALTSRHAKMQHAALIFCGGALVAAAANSPRAHAEARALRKVGTRRRRLTILSVRFGRDGQLKNAYPCPSCMELILASGVQTITWSDDQGNIQRART